MQSVKFRLTSLIWNHLSQSCGWADGMRSLTMPQRLYYKQMPISIILLLFVICTYLHPKQGTWIRVSIIQINIEKFIVRDVFIIRRSSRSGGRVVRSLRWWRRSRGWKLGVWWWEVRIFEGSRWVLMIRLIRVVRVITDVGRGSNHFFRLTKCFKYLKKNVYPAQR